MQSVHVLDVKALLDLTSTGFGAEHEMRKASGLGKLGIRRKTV